MKGKMRVLFCVVGFISAASAQAEWRLAYSFGAMEVSGAYYGSDTDGDSSALTLAWQPNRYLGFAVERIEVEGLSYYQAQECPPGWVCVDPVSNVSYDLPGWAYGVQGQYPITDNIQVFGRASQMEWDVDSDFGTGLESREMLYDIGGSWNFSKYLGVQMIYRRSEQFDDTYLTSVHIRF